MAHPESQNVFGHSTFAQSCDSETAKCVEAWYPVVSQPVARRIHVHGPIAARLEQIISDFNSFAFRVMTNEIVQSRIEVDCSFCRDCFQSPNFATIEYA
jgi:hypothetical protein